MARLGELVPKLLVERGIEVAFAVPSLHTLEFFRGLAGSGLRLVTARDVGHVGFLADGYSRISGTAAVCIVPHGPGLAAVVPAAAQALADFVPMLILSTAQPVSPEGRRAGHRHALRDPAALLRGICLWSRSAATLGETADAIDAAVTQFARGRPGPVHIEIPPGALAAEAGTLCPPPGLLPQPKAPAAAMVAQIVMRLAEARQPLLILGGGAVGMGQAMARELAERMQSPVLLTNNARGLMPPTHPLLAGGWLDSTHVRALITEADAVLAIGTELSPEEWGLVGDDRLDTRPDALIRVDIDAERLYQTATPSLAVASDATLLVETLLASLPTLGAAGRDLAKLRQRAGASMPHRLQRHRALIESVWEHLPEAVICADPCEPTHAGLLCAMPPGPRRWLTGSAGFGAQGWALPAAIGAKLADPRRPVVALMGDGAVMNGIGELATAVETNAHIVLLVWNNTGLGEVREAMRAGHLKPVGVDLSGVDLQPIARGLGAAYARVHGAEFFREAIRSAIMRPGPTVLELREDYWFG